MSASATPFLAEVNTCRSSHFKIKVHLALAQDPRGRRETYAVSVCWLTWEDSKSEVLWGRTDALGEAAVGGNTTSKQTPPAFGESASTGE